MRKITTIVLIAAVIASSALIYTIATETSVVPSCGVSSDAFPIKSSNKYISGVPLISSPPVVSMSHLPNIGETAIVEITYTNDVNDVADTEENRRYDDFETGWRVSSGFEIVDSGGLEYWPITVSPNEIISYKHVEFTPLNAGESKSYCIEVRAISEGHAGVHGYGHYQSEGGVSMYLDDEETLLLHEHRARNPDLYGPHTVPKYERTPLPPMTAEEIKNAEPYVEPTREQFWDFFVDHFNTVPKPSIESAMYSIDHAKVQLGLNATDIRQLLTEGGYADTEIDSELSKRASEQP